MPVLKEAHEADIAGMSGLSKTTCRFQPPKVTDIARGVPKHIINIGWALCGGGKTDVEIQELSAECGHCG
jgi:hypothetical protein